MSYRFVGLKNGERNVHWWKLGIFAVLTFPAVAAVVGLGWFWATGSWSREALLVSCFVSTLIVIRSALRACSIPEGQLDSDATDHATSVSLPGDTEVAGNRSARDKTSAVA